VTGLLPSGMRCSSFWYAQARGLPTDIGYLRVLGLTAYRMAIWEGLAPWQVQEGPFLVHMWPERIFDAACQGLVRDPGCERCDHDTHRCPGCGEPLPHGTEVCAGCDDPPVPPWCPLPQGDQARLAIGY
jgi:hypothetical protein